MNNNYFKDLLISVSQLREIQKKRIKMTRKEIEEKVDKLTLAKNQLAEVTRKERVFVNKCLNVDICPWCGGVAEKHIEGNPLHIKYQSPTFICTKCREIIDSRDYL